MSTPEYTESFGGKAIPSVIFGGVSNHIVAYVSALSGTLSEKPPQDNPTLRSDTFGYRVYCVNAPIPVDTNLFYTYPRWSAQSYASDSQVMYDWTYWRAAQATLASEIPDQSPKWVKTPTYQLELAANQRELRMTFLWPLLPNGNTGDGRHPFRTTIGGQLVATNNTFWPLYFYQPQTFTAAH